jgi:hypothetical protein
MPLPLTPGLVNEALFLGTGFGFPNTLEKDGSVHKVQGTSHVSACVARLCLYKKGDYLGVVSLGGGISGLTFGVNAINKLVTVQRDCETTVDVFEDRVSDLVVSAFKSAENSNEISISTEYTLNSL